MEAINSFPEFSASQQAIHIDMSLDEARGFYRQVLKQTKTKELTFEVLKSCLPYNRWDIATNGGFLAGSVLCISCGGVPVFMAVGGAVLTSAIWNNFSADECEALTELVLNRPGRYIKKCFNSTKEFCSGVWQGIRYKRNK